MLDETQQDDSDSDGDGDDSDGWRDMTIEETLLAFEKASKAVVEDGFVPVARDGSVAESTVRSLAIAVGLALLVPSPPSPPPVTSTEPHHPQRHHLLPSPPSHRIATPTSCHHPPTASPPGHCVGEDREDREEEGEEGEEGEGNHVGGGARGCRFLRRKHNWIELDASVAPPLPWRSSDPRVHSPGRSTLHLPRPRLPRRSWSWPWASRARRSPPRSPATRPPL